MLTLTDILDWGQLDIESLEVHIDIAKHWGIEVYNIRDNIKDMGGDLTNINAWFYSVIDFTFYEVMKEFESYIKERFNNDSFQDEYINIVEKIGNTKDNFSPFINYLDSWYSNLFDSMDLGKDHNEVLQEIANNLELNITIE